MNFVHYRLNMAGNHSRGEKKNLLKRIGSPNGEGVMDKNSQKKYRSTFSSIAWKYFNLFDYYKM